MDLDTVERVVRPRTRADLPEYAPGDAFLAGGTWLYSEPQIGVARVIDLAALDWPPIVRADGGTEIAATCTLADLEAFVWPDEGLATLVRRCCRALWGSFKVRAQATVGGNLCLALPASPMAALAVALDGVCVIWHDGGTREIPAAAFILGEQRTALRPGEVLRSIVLPRPPPAARAFRQTSLTPLGRSAALLIGTREAARFTLTITASVDHPVRLDFPAPPEPGALADAIDARVKTWFDDVHGAPAWRRHVTHLMAADILRELAPCA